MQDSVEIIDPATGRFIVGNSKAWANLGYTREELLSLSVPDIDPLVNSDVFVQNVARLRASPAGFVLESIHQRKDGTTFPVEISAQLYRSNDDREYLVAVVRDVTERKRVEELSFLTRQKKYGQEAHQDN